MKVRTFPQVVKYYKEQDPDTQISMTVLTRWANAGLIPVTKSGRKRMTTLEAVELHLQKAGV